MSRTFCRFCKFSEIADDGDGGKDKRESFRRAEREPNPVGSGGAWENEDCGEDEDHAAHHGDEKALFGFGAGRVEGGRDDVEAGGKKSREIEHESPASERGHFGIAFLVEERDHRLAEEKSRGKKQAGDGKGKRAGKPQDFRQLRLVFFGGGNAYKRLDSLRNARENRDGDKRDVGDDSISCDAGIACKREYGAVEKDHDDTGGKLRDERERPHGKAGGDGARRDPAFYKPEGVRFFEEMQGKDQHADKRRRGGGSRRAEHAEPQREDEEIVEKDIGKAAEEHRRHGEPRIPVVADEGGENVVHDEK